MVAVLPFKTIKEDNENGYGFSFGVSTTDGADVNTF